ncbi:CBS domain-containing protein [Desulfovibrio sp. JC022]|uniref:CBS domain-containing protein n=1 Tax=Desulfovibrio sp. JC022 TaxID=2593642 RepID=UPI0013D57487|nr:CBS domain-containing protein [Desulfovibrio sp. JC022]
MKNFKAKDLMIPVEEYNRVKEDTTLFEALQCLAQQGDELNLPHPHRDLLVENADGKVVGKITMLDIFKHMEPSYFKMDDQRHPGALSMDFVQKVYRDFNLWSEPLSSLCRKNAGAKAEEIMHTPKQAEILDEDDTLDKALHAFVLGVHQPLLVQKDGIITGVVRLGDAFDKVRTAVLACEIETA